MIEKELVQSIIQRLPKGVKYGGHYFKEYPDGSVDVAVAFKRPKENAIMVLQQKSLLTTQELAEMLVLSAVKRYREADDNEYFCG